MGKSRRTSPYDGHFGVPERDKRLPDGGSSFQKSGKEAEYRTRGGTEMEL